MNRLLVCSLSALLLSLPVAASDVLREQEKFNCPTQQVSAQGDTAAQRALGDEVAGAPKAAVGAGGAGSSSAPAPRAVPRWHSYLPGMIR